MPISSEDAGTEIQRFLTGLNASKHSAREKALKAFKAFVEKQGMEFYDDDVDSLLLGDGYTMGLMQWCGESSTGTQGALKRWGCETGWLLSSDKKSIFGSGNICYLTVVLPTPPVCHECPLRPRCRTAATAISLLKWLVSLRDSSGDENIFLARFLQVGVPCKIPQAFTRGCFCALETCARGVIVRPRVLLERCWEYYVRT